MGRNEDDDDIKRKSSSSRRHRKCKDRKKRKHRDYDDVSLSDSGTDGSSPDDDSSYDSGRRERKADKKRSKKHDRKRHKKEKKKKKERKRHKKEKKRRHRYDDDEHKETTAGSTTVSSPHLERNYAFGNAVYSLLQQHPNVATDLLPLMLMRLAHGTMLDLNQMPDVSVSQGLHSVFVSLQPFGVMQEGSSWTWKSPGPNNNREELILIKVARQLLNEIGVTMEAVRDYEEEESKAASIKEATDNNSNIDETSQIALRQQTHAMLQQFDQSGSSGSKASLAKELRDICNLILSGESIALDGLPDKDLRNAMEQLFSAVGLEQHEIDNDSDDEAEAEEDGGTIMGYGLPEEHASHARTNMLAVLEACQDQERSRATTVARRTVRGPSLPPSSPAAATGVVPIANDDSNSDDEDGPAPVGSVKAKKRVQRGPAMPPELIQAAAERRKRELDGVATGVKPQKGDVGAREEWMMEPGEHELLQGIKSGNPLKNRNFRNEKQSSRAVEPDEPVHPAIQAKMDEIKMAHEAARGPSLIEQHRLKKAEEKAAAVQASGKSEWKWSRDNDLDAGRRVDKNALNMVMGGAKDSLKDKFQGGYSRGYM